jgi:hypothetical protein
MPPDLFMSLYRTANDFKTSPSPEAIIDEILNDPETAKRAFKNLKATDFASESAVVAMLEATFDTIGEFGLPTLQRGYSRLITRFVRNHNLRYRFIAPFQLQPLLTGTFVQLYREMEIAVSGDEHLGELLTAFEVAFAAYAKSATEPDLKRCIGTAISLAEGMAGKATGTPGRTLGEYCDSGEHWPHRALSDSLKKVYGFCSDYPGIRHGGNPAGRIRSLESRDVLILCSLIAFLGYLSSDLDLRAAV